MNEKGKSGKVNYGNSAFMPKEEHLETAVRFRRISIGIPSDIKDDEKRVALTPEAVNLLVESDNEVIIQKGAGIGANYTDRDYSENGATITDSPARVYSSDVVIKVAPFTEKETDYLKGNQVLMSLNSLRRPSRN
jgi:alanine dehydrogenase